MSQAYEIKIEKGIPIPLGVTGVTAILRAMEVGDSFFYAGKPIGYFSALWRPLDGKYTSRSVTENGVAGVRVWRIK